MPNEIDIAGLRKDYAELDGLEDIPFWAHKTIASIPRLLDEVERLRETLVQAEKHAYDDEDASMRQSLRVQAAEDRISILEKALDVVVAERDALKIKLDAVRDVATAPDVRGAGGFTSGQKYVQGRLLAILETLPLGRPGTAQ